MLLRQWLLLLAFLVVPTAFILAQDGWPVRAGSGDTRYQIFAPQPESLDGTRFSARAAVSIQRGQDKDPIFGAIWGDGTMEMDRDSRLGRITRFTVSDARFPGIEGDEELGRIRRELSEAIPANAPPISIDWMIAALEEEQRSDERYENDPPEIIYRETPAALVFIDGEAIYEELDATARAQDDPLYRPRSRERIERVVNTPFMILRVGGDHFLYGSGMWFKARNLDGPWQREQNVSADLQRLANEVEDAAALTADDRPTAGTPEIIVRHAPAELLDVDGKPALQPVQNTSLLTITNTSRSVFMDIGTQEYYFLASGRWFSTKDLNSGNWSFVPSDRLPEEFRKIPEGSNRDMVLAHVAGTDAAREAVRDASIPQTAQVDRHSASVEVRYNGDPEFERIDGTNVAYARNANTDVLLIDGHYHVCDNGVWYDGPTPDGPWAVSTEVPEEVQGIPPSSPVYNVRYVHIYDHTPDIVYVGYTPGYLGSYVQHGVVIFGTGHYYRPWGGFWRPRPWTWGFNMYYDPWFGWGMGWGWGYNWVYPAWGWWGPRPYYAWGWWGPYAWHPPCCITAHQTVYGHRPSITGSNTRTSIAGGTERVARAGDLYATTERTGIRASRIDGDDLPQRTLNERAATESRRSTAGDHFTDAAGNVYRQSGDRTQRYENGGWSRVRPEPATRTPQRGDDPVQRTEPQQRDAPATRDQRPQTRPQVDPQRPQRTTPRGTIDPFRIQRDRQRGVERQRYFQQRSPQVRPSAPGRAPGRVAPSGSPGRSPGSVSPGGGGRPGGGSAPARGGGGRSR